METIQLSNGIQMPKMGIGTDDVIYLWKKPSSKNRYVNKLLNFFNKYVWKHAKEKEYVEILCAAFKMGYRLIDTSISYHNEHIIGKAIKQSGIPRKEFFITTRIGNYQQYNHCVRESFMESLQQLGVEYVDLLQFHWPVPEHFLDTWKEMEKLYHEGYAKAIGTANCHAHHLQGILNVCEVSPMVNEVEVHPLLTQKPLLDFCKKFNIVVEAYSPLARNDFRMLRNREVQAMMRKYNKTFLQIVLRWHIQNGVVPIPRSTNLKRLKENISVFDFELTKEEMAAIDGININSRLRFDPDNCDFTQL